MDRAKPHVSPLGITQEGKPSAHTLNNTGPRRFLVIEFDTGSEDEQAGIVVAIWQS